MAARKKQQKLTMPSAFKSARGAFGGKLQPPKRAGAAKAGAKKMPSGRAKRGAVKKGSAKKLSAGSAALLGAKKGATPFPGAAESPFG